MDRTIRVNTAYSESSRVSYFEYFHIVDEDQLPVVGDCWCGETCIKLERVKPDVYNTAFVWDYDLYRATYKYDDGGEEELCYAVRKKDEESEI